MILLHFYRATRGDFEYCFYIETACGLSGQELRTLKWLLSETFEPDKFSPISIIGNGNIIELGPRMNFETAYSTNAVAICRSCGLQEIVRLERSRRYLAGKDTDREAFIGANHDRMTEYLYSSPLESFKTGIIPEKPYPVPILEEGTAVLEEINDRMGLGLDSWDINFYFDLFANKIGRNPTNVECFQLSQANSEHSRHWFFKGRLILDGKEVPETLFQLIQAPLEANPSNSLIAFKDNSSAIKGYRISTIMPSAPGLCSPFIEKKAIYHLILTAETHNFPSGIAPFPGAETGTGGRIRDVEATGRGGLVIAGTAGYCTGNLNIPDYAIPGEDKDFTYPSNMAAPLDIMIGESNGASDYGNKFGEPVIQGFTRTFGQRLPDGQRREWVKPIMFSGGIGQMDGRHTVKEEPARGMLIIQIGGPAYRIGVGGGAASSLIQEKAREELDFNAVQRGNAQMEQKLNRVIRACIEMGDKNPILSVHDQGAGGPCNVLTEIVEPAGGRIEIRNIELGDRTMSVLEIWSAEYQERNAFLIPAQKLELLQSICDREKVNLENLGEITGDGRIVVHDNDDGTTPVDLDLGQILSNIPQKTFELESIKKNLRKLDIPPDLSAENALRMVFKLPSVGSKGFLVRKVDRSVTGLIARQQ
ncbi:MAG: phosphoribosylformylglycinamidine synthase, partial [Actinomycetia bacterium]|nr:phosphoribosylformylglycinamidine synthase [Actinomycetes bacterium]